MHRKPPRFLELLHSQHSTGRHRQHLSRWPAVAVAAILLLAGLGGTLFASAPAAGSPAVSFYTGLTQAQQQASQEPAPAAALLANDVRAARAQHLYALARQEAARDAAQEAARDAAAQEAARDATAAAQAAAAAAAAQEATQDTASIAPAPQQPAQGAPAASGSWQGIVASMLSSGSAYCLDQIIIRESGGNVYASNPGSGAYGIPQALPGSKMASAGADWATNPVTQIRWMVGYVDSTYGSPCGAWSFWQSHSYY